MSTDRIVPRWLIVVVMAAWVAVLCLCVLSGCMTPAAIDYHRRHPEYRLFRHKGRLVYPKVLDPYAVPHEIVRQMTEREYRVWMDALREMGR